VFLDGFVHLAQHHDPVLVKQLDDCRNDPSDRLARSRRLGCDASHTHGESDGEGENSDGGSLQAHARGLDTLCVMRVPEGQEKQPAMRGDQKRHVIGIALKTRSTPSNVQESPLFCCG
jgi:hypothetical protein